MNKKDCEKVVQKKNESSFYFWGTGWMFTLGVMSMDPATVSAFGDLAVGWKVLSMGAFFGGWPVILGMTIGKVLFQ